VERRWGVGLAEAGELVGSGEKMGEMEVKKRMVQAG